MSGSPPELPPGLGVNPWGLFVLIELCFAIAFYQVFGHLPWNLSTIGMVLFGLLSFANLLAMHTAMNSPGFGQSGGDEEPTPPGENDEIDWEIDVDWDDIDVGDENR